MLTQTRSTPCAQFAPTSPDRRQQLTRILICTRIHTHFTFHYASMWPLGKMASMTVSKATSEWRPILGASGLYLATDGRVHARRVRQLCFCSTFPRTARTLRHRMRMAPATLLNKHHLHRIVVLSATARIGICCYRYIAPTRHPYTYVYIYIYVYQADYLTRTTAMDDSMGGALGRYRRHSAVKCSVL